MVSPSGVMADDLLHTGWTDHQYILWSRWGGVFCLGSCIQWEDMLQVALWTSSTPWTTPGCIPVIQTSARWMTKFIFLSHSAQGNSNTTLRKTQLCVYSEDTIWGDICLETSDKLVEAPGRSGLPAGLLSFPLCITLPVRSRTSF